MTIVRSLKSQQSRILCSSSKGTAFGGFSVFGLIEQLHAIERL